MFMKVTKVMFNESIILHESNVYLILLQNALSKNMLQKCHIKV